MLNEQNAKSNEKKTKGKRGKRMHFIEQKERKNSRIL